MNTLKHLAQRLVHTTFIDMLSGLERPSVLQEAQQGVLDAVLRTLTCPGEALVAKGLVIVTLMCEVSPLWLLMACEGGLPALVGTHHDVSYPRLPCLAKPSFGMLGFQAAVNTSGWHSVLRDSSADQHGCCKSVHVMVETRCCALLMLWVSMLQVSGMRPNKQLGLRFW